MDTLWDMRHKFEWWEEAFAWNRSRAVADIHPFHLINRCVKHMWLLVFKEIFFGLNDICFSTMSTKFLCYYYLKQNAVVFVCIVLKWKKKFIFIKSFGPKFVTLYSIEFFVRFKKKFTDFDFSIFWVKHTAKLIQIFG